MALKRLYVLKFSWGAYRGTPLEVLAPKARVGQIRVRPRKISKPVRLCSPRINLVPDPQVFVLGRVTPQQFKKISYPPDDSGPPFVNPDPLSSNIYSVGERILLAWFNHHYREQKQKTWTVNSKDKDVAL